MRHWLLCALALLAFAAPAQAQNVLINPCSGNICFGTGGPTDVFVVTDGVKRIKFTFDGTEIVPETTAVTSLGTSAKQFKDGQFSGTIAAGAMTFGDGTAAAPSITFTSDTDSGRYRIGANNVGEAVNGARVFDWNATRLLSAIAIQLPNTGLQVLDSNSSHYLSVVPGSDLTADRVLTLTTGDAARTVTLSGNPTLSDWFDQSVKAAASPTFAGATLTQGTITVSTPGINHTATWNDAGVTFTNILSNVTNTASDAASKLIDLQVGGSTQFNVTRAGVGTFTGAATAAGLTSTASVRANTTYTLNGVLLDSVTAPTIGSGFGTSPTVPNNNGTAAFTVDVGTGGTASSGVITMPAATTGWICHVENRTAVAANTANARTVQTATTTTSVTVQNQTISTGAALAWTASDILTLSCRAY